MAGRLFERVKALFRKTEAESPPAVQRKPGSSYHAVAIVPGRNACAEACALRDRRFLSRAAPVLPLPGFLARVQARLMELAPGEPLMSRDNLDSMKTPNVASGSLPGLASLGIEPAALEAVVPDYLGHDQGTARFERWRARR
jgi:hypothetical protein